MGEPPLVSAATHHWLRAVLQQFGLRTAAFYQQLLQGYPAAAAGVADGEQIACSSPKLPRDAPDTFALRALEVAALVRGAVPDDPAVQAIVLRRFAELVLYNFLGVERAASFLRVCQNQHSIA